MRINNILVSKCCEDCIKVKECPNAVDANSIIITCKEKITASNKDVKSGGFLA